MSSNCGDPECDICNEEEDGVKYEAYGTGPVETSMPATDAIAMTITAESLKKAVDSLKRASFYGTGRPAVPFPPPPPTRRERFANWAIAFLKRIWVTEPIEDQVRRVVEKGRKVAWKFVAYFYYNGIHLSLGVHLSFKPPNIEIHVPCGFFRVGLQRMALDLEMAEEETKNFRAFGFEGRWW